MAGGRTDISLRTIPHQITRAGYCDTSGSGVRIASPCTMAWHTSMRSNGSRCSAGSRSNCSTDSSSSGKRLDAVRLALGGYEPVGRLSQGEMPEPVLHRDFPRGDTAEEHLVGRIDQQGTRAGRQAIGRRHHPEKRARIGEEPHRFARGPRDTGGPVAPKGGRRGSATREACSTSASSGGVSNAARTASGSGSKNASGQSDRARCKAQVAALPCERHATGRISAIG